MYLRRHSKKVDGENYGYWSLVESVRTIRGLRQRIVATIGKLPGLDKEERIGWEEIKRILDGKPRPEAEVFEAYEEPPLLLAPAFPSDMKYRVKGYNIPMIGNLLVANRFLYKQTGHVC